MKLISKIMNLGLIGLTASPVATNLNINSTTIINIPKHNVDESKLRCTITYVGKDCTPDGLAIIARATDASPRASNSKLVKFNHNQRANATLKNVDGFEYKLPSETYAYIAAPDSPKTDVKDDQNQFENFGINEMGVGVSCTLTCYTNATAEAADNFVRTGICEEMFNQVLVPQADSARKAMEIAAKVIDEHGSAEPNIIMAIDQNEAWLMEIYTGHQYCAIKLPDDKMCVVGNEFFLNTLDELGISEANKENCILSKDLLNLPLHARNPFAVFDGPTHDIYHLDLFKTYAKELGQRDPSTREEVSNTDYSHMRTWRGYSLFNPSSRYGSQYTFDEKYPAFFEPTDSVGRSREVSIENVMQVYRDEYDELINDPDFERFTKAKQNNTLRCIAAETTRSVHIITSNPNLPKEIACNAIYCPSSANYTPYVVLNNGMNSIDGEYGYAPDRYGYDDKCSATLFRRLNALAWTDRENYGYPVQHYCESLESIYNTQMLQVINDASKLKLNTAKKIITNFNKHVRDINIAAVKTVTEDLMWHIMDDPAPISKHTIFNPLIDFETYLADSGWTNFNRQGNTITCKYKTSNCKLEFGEGYYREKGKITIDGQTDDILLRCKDNKVYVDVTKINSLLVGKSEIKKVNIYDYLDKANTSVIWIAPLSIIGAAGLGVGIYFLVKKRKSINKNTQAIA